MNRFEECECKAICEKYRLHIEDANFAQALIPKKILLDSTRNIHSYFVFCKIEGACILSPYWEKKNFRKSLKSMLALQYSDLDRPLFFIYKKKDIIKIIEGNDLREAFLKNPNVDIVKYVTENSYDFIDLLLIIKNEL